MVLDSLNLKLESNFTNLLRLAMYHPSTRQRPLVEGGTTRQYRWRVRLQDWLHGGRFFSIAFMFSTIYLRLEEVPPTPPKDWDVGACTDGDSDCRVENDFFL